MTTKTPHKHAALIKQWADGAEIQVRAHDSQPWETSPFPPRWCQSSLYRVKPETITIGAHEVPAPMRVAPEIGTMYYVITAIGRDGFFLYKWSGEDGDTRILQRGQCWHTREDAALASKAIIELLTGGDK